MANSDLRKEEKRQKDLKALIDGKMDSYGVTKRTIYSAIGIFGCLVLTVVMSITGMGFDPSVFGTWNYWTKMIVQFAIAIFSMITGRQIGDDTQRNKPNGQFRRELSNYKQQYDRIDTKGYIDYFDTWLTDYRERKLQKKIRDTLIEFGIKQQQVLDLYVTEIDNLKEPWVKDWTGTPFYDKYYDKETGEAKTFFLPLTELQIEALRQIMEGKVQVANVPSSYFLDALKNTSTDEWERAEKADRKRGAKLATGYTYKIVGMLVISLILNGLIPSPYDSPEAVALNIVTRIFVLITSVVWGIYLGFKVVDMDIVFLTYKSYILHICSDEFDKGIYKPETIEEQAKRLFDEHEKEKQEAIKNVVQPEVVSGSAPLLTGGEQ